MKRPDYHHLVKHGMAPRLAEMLALGAAPALKTDTQFLHGRHQAFGTDDVYLVKKLKALGADPNGVYHPYLAEFPGDPKAVCASRDDIKKRCEEKGWSCDGTVKVKGRDAPPLPAPDIAPDIVERETQRAIEQDPSKGTTKKKRDDTKQAVRQRLRGKEYPKAS